IRPIPERIPSKSPCLLDFDSRADLGELLLDVLGGFLGDSLLDGLRAVVHQILGFLQAQAGAHFADDLDDLDLLGADILEDDVELGLLLFGSGSSGGGGGGSHGDGSSGGNAELLLKFLYQVSKLQNSHGLNSGNDLFAVH